MSKSGILKSGWIMMNTTDTRIIDTNALVESKLKELSMKLAEETMGDANFSDGFSQGIDPVEVAELVRDDDGQEYDFDQQEEGFVSPDEQMLENVQMEIEAMKQEAMAEIESMKEQILKEAQDEGYRQGLERGVHEGYEKAHKEAMAAVEEERQQYLQELENRETELEELYQERFSQLEPKFIETLTAIYEHIFKVSLKNSKDIVVHLLANTMKNLEGNSGYLVHVSKDDYPFVSMQKKEILKGTSIAIENVDIIEDATLQKSECTIETGNGVFDCSLGTQLEALNEELRLLSYEPNKDEE